MHIVDLCDKQHVYILFSIVRENPGIITDSRGAAADCAIRMRGDSIQSRSIDAGRGLCQHLVLMRLTCSSRRRGAIDLCIYYVGVMYDERVDFASSTGAPGHYQRSLDSPCCSLDYLLSFQHLVYSPSSEWTDEWRDPGTGKGALSSATSTTSISLNAADRTWTCCCNCMC